MTSSLLLVTAAVKSEALLRLAVEHGVIISLDNVDEATDLLEIAEESDQQVPVALRLASDNPAISPTRFGLRAEQWNSFLEQSGKPGKLKVDGIHFHLNGYDGG
ncbi:UNVERIFIED_CONTAM: alanine racemase [Actinomycetes bacterium ARC8]|nr:alanine racemase [Actinomycetes bacterium ARC8]